MAFKALHNPAPTCLFPTFVFNPCHFLKLFLAPPNHRYFLKETMSFLVTYPSHRVLSYPWHLYSSFETELKCHLLCEALHNSPIHYYFSLFFFSVLPKHVLIFWLYHHHHLIICVFSPGMWGLQNADMISPSPGLIRSSCSIGMEWVSIARKLSLPMLNSVVGIQWICLAEWIYEWMKMTWVVVLILPTSSCVTLCKSLHLTNSAFSSIKWK